MQKSKKAVSDQATYSMTFFLGMALFLTFIVIVGFWPTYYGHYLLGQELLEGGRLEITWKTHVHAFVFMAWMGLLIYQTMLVAGNRTGQHTRVGKYGFFWGVLVALLGLVMMALILQTGIQKGLTTFSRAMPRFLLHGGFFAIFEFILLLGLGFAYRKSPDAHKRYMLFATIALANAAAGRWGLLVYDWTGPWASEIIHVAMVAPIWIYDLRKIKSIHMATLIGSFIIGLYFLRRLI